jgi:hypothetical protein
VLSLGFLLCLAALPLAAAPNAGKISGLVVDPAGTPQMGATVLISSEELAGMSPVRLLTNASGRFSSSTLPTGSYSIHVTLAGFLPAIEQHIQVDTQRATLLEIVLGSVFSSFEKLRRQQDQPVAPDDWTWVLRSSAATRPVLRWQDDGTANRSLTQVEASQRPSAHGRLELSSGADHPGSIADLADSPGTSFAYDVGLGARGQLLVAGQYSYENASSAGGFASEWLPSGEQGSGPVTTLLVREAQMGPQGPTFRGLRLSHDGQFALSDRVSVRYGAQYLLAGFNGTTSAIRPHAEVAVQIASGWLASAIFATDPWQGPATTDSPLESTLNTLDAFPTLMIRGGRPVLENGMHEEVALDHALGKHSDISAAVFEDRSTHTAVIGRGEEAGPDFLEDYFSEAFAYDGGVTSSTGTRVAYRRKLGDHLATTLVYAYAGALAPNGDTSAPKLRDELATRYRHSLAAGMSASVPRLGTKFSVGYKWLSGRTVSQQDPYGESLYNLDPYLSMQIRQPLPSVFPGHMEVEANVGNLLAQGYVPVAAGDGYILLVPSYRYFRGGFSLQF